MVVAFYDCRLFVFHQHLFGALNHIDPLDLLKEKVNNQERSKTQRKDLLQLQKKRRTKEKKRRKKENKKKEKKEKRLMLQRENDAQ